MVEMGFSGPLELYLSPAIRRADADPLTQQKQMIDSVRNPPLLSAPMKNILILVVGLRMGKAV